MMLTIEDYLKCDHLQMAAQAFIRDEVSGQLADSQDQYIAVLVRGNDHSSRFVKIQAEKFADEWKVLDQRANTKTDFGGTLFCNKNTNETVLSLRSIEFIDDAAQDNKATNELEIKKTGFACGQIVDMQQWHAGLKENGAMLCDPLTRQSRKSKAQCKYRCKSFVEKALKVHQAGI